MSNFRTKVDTPLRIRARERERVYMCTAQGRAKQLFSNAKQNSKHRGLAPPTITKQWIIDQISKGCCLTGLPFVLDGLPLHPRAPSLDRMDNSRPYTADNTRVVLWAINLGLGTWGASEYARVASAFLEHSKNPHTIY